MLKPLPIALAVAVTFPAFAAPTCFTETEWEAAHVKLLQQELQVTALECQSVQGYDFAGKYTVFIGKFQPRLKADAQTLQSYFRRVYGAHGSEKLDQFITHVANEVSSKSMQDMKFCANSGPGFDMALDIEVPKLEQVAVDRVRDHSVIGELCEAKAAPVTAAPNLPASAKKPG